MKQSRPSTFATASADATEHLEARVGLRIASLLSQSAEMPEHAVAERLRFAREQALAKARARSPQVVTATAPVLVGSARGGAGMLAAPRGWWMRMASALPLLVLLAGLVAIDEWNDRAEIEAAVDIDTALLGDDLPPDAYSDPGFAEFLKTSRE